MASLPAETGPAPYVPGSRSASRPRRTRHSDWVVWWREIDRVLLFFVLILMGIGAVAVAASSPASARRLSTAKEHLDDAHFFWLQIRWQAAGLVTMIAASRLSRENARRLGILLGFAMLGGLMLVPIVGSTVNGAKRWLHFGVSLQPSEFLKPAFAITLAWILSWRLRDPKMPVLWICTGIMALVGVLLMLQPDFGSTVLFAGVWFVMMVMAGLPPRIILAIVGAVPVVIGLVYALYENGRHRIDAFLGGGSSFDQVDLAHRTLVAGGWTGTGLWLGTRKLGLPEAHTDYIFSVVGEEFGLWMCGLIIVIYFAMVARVLVRLGDEDDLFAVLAAGGLIAQLGGQAFINILVNLQLFPSKGMTLPLISYGGSSTLALCMTVGFLLAITRRNPYLKADPFTPKGALPTIMSLFK
ncbi:cell division protein FtsW [Novosphingobium umbonatum]|uniref:Probable peptidoglycan glycosyltransferase FtsW n=1 Tax=Novosphingobium umbonatum TaxID=1908524 RepID=A0A3S2UXD2_9SPHN|nr:putative peptidoglycan glycosyltransferase FtsW [Novosphingobium umbonatum]RVU07610.1 cell division protein FtsW [Novosphingobium umbonatum]